MRLRTTRRGLMARLTKICLALLLIAAPLAHAAPPSEKRYTVSRVRLQARGARSDKDCRALHLVARHAS
jgi:hypothetical protein